MSRRRFMGEKSFSLVGLIDYYKFNSTTRDEVTGTINSASVSYSAGKIGNAAYFGSYSPLKFARNSGTFNNFTVSLWVKLNSGSFPGQYRGIFVSRASDETKLYGLCIEDKTLIVYDNGIRRYTTTLPTGNWIMITLVIKGGNGTIYINGVEKSTFSFSTFYVQSATYIGCDYLPVTTSQNNRGLRGYLDEMSVWSRALSASEISELYNNGNGLEL